VWPGRQNNGQARLDLQQLAAELQPVHDGHGQIGDDQGERIRLIADGGDGVQRAGLLGHGVTKLLKHFFADAGQRLLIVQK
jgi:hypothetical protein